MWLYSIIVKFPTPEQRLNWCLALLGQGPNGYISTAIVNRYFVHDYGQHVAVDQNCEISYP